jgi:hypothetical protein
MKHDGLSQVTILAERLRFEEKLISSAFQGAGYSARLVEPERLSSHLLGARHALFVPNGSPRDLILSRLPASSAYASLSALIAADGASVTNEPELAAKLADRVILARWMAASGFETLPVRAGYGEESILQAIEATGFPAAIAPRDADVAPVMAEDLATAEAVVEHMTVLGDERLILVRPALPESVVRRVVVCGEATFVAESDAGWPGVASTDGWRPVHPDIFDRDRADRLRTGLGAGIYAADFSADGVLLDIAPLGAFRHFHEAGFNVAGAVVDHVLAGMSEAAVA